MWLKIIFTVFLLFFLTSCWDNLNWTYKEVSIEKLDNNNKIEKDSNTEQKTPEKEVIEVAQKEIIENNNNNSLNSNINASNLTNSNWNDKETQLISLNNLESIEKINSDKYDYEKLSNWVLTDEILMASNVKMQNLIRIKYIDLLEKDFIEYDKDVFSKINPDLSNYIFSKDVILIEKKESENFVEKKEYVNETYIDKELKERTKKVIKNYYIFKKWLKIYKFDKNKTDIYLKNERLYWFYLNWNDIFPVSENWLIGYFNIYLLDYLIKDKKAGILQFLPLEKGLLNLNSSTTYYINEHYKILEPYIKKVLKFEK